MKSYRPTTPSRRHTKTVTYRGVLTASEPQKSLTKGRKRFVGRNNAGRITVRHKGGGHKRLFREVDFLYAKKDILAKVETIEYDPYRTAFIARVSYKDGDRRYVLAPNGLKVGDTIISGEDALIAPGNRTSLKRIPVGTFIHNIEIHVGDGGKMVRSSGVFARIIAKTEQGVQIKLPSKKEKILNPACRAAIGVVAGSGRPEKPFMKAGTRFHRMAARNKLYPRVCGISMNAVDHPFGGKGSHTKGRPTQSPRNAPPGRKVGKIAPRRTGRKK